MTIPKRLIDKAARAAHEAYSSGLLHDYDDTPAWYRRSVEGQAAAALEAVAADIWDEGADAGETVGYGIARDNWAPRIPNPYRASETA